MNYSVPRIGYACNNLDLTPNVFKTCRINRLDNSRLVELIAHNLDVLEAMIDYSIENNNHMLRLSSSIIPFASSKKNTFNWSDYFKENFSRMYDKIANYDIRISCHPGQYTVLNSPDPLVLGNSIAELEYHCKLLELLSGKQSAKMVLHIGGVYGNKEDAIAHFIKVYHRHEALLRKHLVIENDDRLYTIEDVLYISEKTSLPVVFDNLHHLINPSLLDHSISDILQKVKMTWASQDGNPKVHYSQQAMGKRPGAHSTTIDLNLFQQDYIRAYRDFGFDIMLEVKDKNRSFLKVNALLHPSKQTLEKEWARYKYWVLARSHPNYLAIRSMLKQDHVDVVSFYEIIDRSINARSSFRKTVNALHHIWGYFKKTASEKEKEYFFKLVNDFHENACTELFIIKYLKRLSIKYNQTYLLSSYYLNPNSFQLTNTTMEDEHVFGD